MAQQTNLPRIGLPRGWPQRVRSAMLHTLRATAVLAILLVAGRGHRPLPAARYGLLNLPEASDLAHSAQSPGKTDRSSQSHTQIRDLRQGRRLPVRGLQALVSPQTNSPALWRGRAARKHRPDRTFHQDHERREHAPNPGSAAANELPPGAQPLLRLVQRVSPSYGDRGQDSQRGLPPIAPGESTATHRTPQTLATSLTPRRTVHAHRRTARRSIHNQGRVPRWGAASASPFAEACGVGHHERSWLAGFLR